MKNIAFFLSAQDISEKYTKPALELIELCVEKKYHFVYGGSNYGFMKQAAAHVRGLKGKIIGVSSEEFKSVLNTDCDETFIEIDVLARKRKFLEKSDALVALPGGTGTLDEITDIIALKKLDRHHKPIILFNTDGFWNGLVTQMQKMHDEGFLSKKVEDLIYVSDSPVEVITYLSEKLK